MCFSLARSLTRLLAHSFAHRLTYSISSPQERSTSIPDSNEQLPSTFPPVTDRVHATHIHRYQIRLESKRSKATRLLLCTTGILLRRLQVDPWLASISHVFVDEARSNDITHPGYCTFVFPVVGFRLYPPCYLAQYLKLVRSVFLWATQRWFKHTYDYVGRLAKAT